MDPSFQEYFNNVEVYDEEAEQAPAKSEVDTIQAFLSGNLPANEAAQLLARRPTQPTVALTKKLRMSMLWSFINNIAVAFPSTQPLIVDLLKEIRKSEPVGAHRDPANREANWSTLGTWLIKWGDSINSKRFPLPPSLKARANSPLQITSLVTSGLRQRAELRRRSGHASQRTVLG